MFSGNVAFTLLRYILTLAGGALVSRGYVTGGAMELGIGTLVAGLSAAYGTFTATKDAQLSSVAKMMDVEAVKMDDGTSILSDGGKVYKLPNAPMSDR